MSDECLFEKGRRLVVDEMECVTEVPATESRHQSRSRSLSRMAAKMKCLQEKKSLALYVSTKQIS